MLEFPELKRAIEEFDDEDRARDGWAFYGYFEEGHGVKFPVWIDGRGNYRYGSRW